MDYLSPLYTHTFWLSHPGSCLESMDLLRCADYKGPVVQYANMVPAASLQLFTIVKRYGPVAGLRSADMVHRTSSGRCLEDLQPCFTHMRHNARSEDFAAVDRSGKRLLHSDFSKMSCNPSSACRMSPWCSSTLCGHVGGYGSRSKWPGAHQ